MNLRKRITRKLLTIPKRFVVLTGAIALLILSSFSAMAVTKTWTGATNNDWNTGSNWGGTAPAAGDIANIPGGLTNYPIVNNSVTILTLNINSSGSGASVTVVAAGSLTVTGVLTVLSNGTFSISGGAATISGAAVPTFVVSAGGILTQSGGTLSVTVSTASITGTFNQSGGTYLSGFDLGLNSGAVLNQSGTGKIHMDNVLATAPTKKIVINPGATVNQTGGTIEVKDFYLLTNSTAVFNQSGATSLLTIEHDYKNSGGTFNSTGGTIKWNSSVAVSAAAEFDLGINQFYNIQIDGNSAPGFSKNFTCAISVAGNWTNNNYYTDFDVLASTITFNGSGNQTFTSTVTSYLYNVVVDKSGGTLSLNDSYLFMWGSLTVNQGTFSLATNALEVQTSINMNGGTLNLGSGSLKYYSTMTIAGGDITGTSAYMYAGGDITISSGTINVPSGSMDLYFSITNNNDASAFTYGTVNLWGAAKTIGGTATTAFSALTVNNTATYTTNSNITCSSLNFAVSGNVCSFTMAAGTTLTISGDLTINQPSASKVVALYVNAASVTVNGNVYLGGNNTSTGRVAKIIITTGTLDIRGNLVYNSASGVNVTAVLDMSGGAGNTYLAGNMTLTNTSGTLTPGTTSTFTFNGSGSQSVGAGGAITYNYLTINKPSGTATLGAALSLKDLNLLSGTFASAGYALTISGNVLNNGGTMTGSPATTFTGTAKTISGTGTTDFGTVTINNGKTYTMSSTNTATGLTFVAGGTNTSLTQTSTGIFTVNGNVTINQPTSNTRNIAWNINSGTATVTGNINIGGTNTTTTRIAKVVITTGTLNANSDIVFNAASGKQQTAVIDMSGGAGILNLKGSLTLTNTAGTLTPGTSSTVNFNGTSGQSVSFASAIRYNNIYSNNAATVTVSAAVTSTLVTGDIRIQTGIFSNGGFAIGMATSKTFEVVNGATFKLTGTSAMVTGTTIVKTFGATSTVEYGGTTQTVSNEMYGHLTLSSSSGAAVKTMPNTAMTIAGNLTSNLGAGTSVSYTALANYTTGGNVSIGASTTFNGSTFTHSLAGNWVNNGTFTVSTSTITMTGASTTISGSGTLAFNDLILTGSNITAGAVNISVAGNLSSTGVGSFTHSGGGFTMSGTSKTITGTGFSFNDLTLSGTISTTSVLTVAGNLAAGGAGSFTSSAGSVTMSGTSKTITATGAISLYNLTVTGTVTTATSFTISAVLTVTGSLTASAGTATFTGTSVLNGTANLYNVTLNGTSLQLAMNSTLGIANTYTISAGSLNVTSTTPNTVHFNGTNPQNIAAGTFHHLKFSNGTNTAAGVITVNGDFTINSGASFTASSSYYIYVKNNFVNSGTFTASSGTVQFDGAADGSITGATTFYNIIVNKSASTNTVTVNSNISVGTIIMSLGMVSTGTNTLNITTTRTGTGIILGWIQRTHAFTTGVAYEFESPNNSITFTAASGLTSVLVKVSTGAIGDFPFGGSINRLYDISIPAGTYTATLRLHYEDAELNGNTESSITLWKYSGSWVTAGKSNNSTTSNWVEQTGLTSIATRWTFSDDNNVMSWNGSVSTNWNTAANWTVVQGTPGSVPSANDIAQIGVVAFTNAPAISTAAVAKSITFGSAQAATLTLNAGGSLTTQGNISGTWSANATHTINANNQNITVNGDIVLSDGTSNHAINLNIGTGTVTMTGSLTESGGANITFSGTGALVIGNNFTYASGTFTKSTGTVTFNGTGAQAVAAVNYNNLVINKTGIATISGATTISGDLTITTGELDINAASTITGNVSIASGAILASGTVNNNVGGNWSNSGTFTPNSGMITLNGSSTQTISAGTFNNFTINKSAGTAILGNVTINGSVSLLSGTLDLSTFTLNRNTLGGSFSMSNGTTLYLAGAANFPSNYGTYTLGATSTVNYNGTVAQSVAGITYGHLVFTNGTSNAKTLAANTTVNGDLAINSGATFAAGAYTLNIAGNWTNSGTFTPSTSTVILSGTTRTINGNTTFNKLTVSGTYSVPGNDITTNGLFYIQTGGSVASTTGTITVSGDITNNGTLTSTGTTTFTGTGAQTIQLVNCTTTLNLVNFNGTVAPIMSSTSSPTYATVNINNTGGITSNVSWTVTTAFNVAVGTSFNGATATHTFNGSFTNNGTVSTGGTFNFNTSATQTIKLAGTSFSSTGTVIFAGSGAISVTGTPATLTNITISNTTGVTPAANWAMGGNFLVNSNAVFNAGTYSYSVAGDLLSSGTLNGGTSTFTMSSGAGTLSGSTTTTFYDLVISGTASATADFNVSHNFTNNGSYDGTNATLNMTGSAASIIGGSAATYNLAQLSIQKTGGAATTLAHNILAVTSLDVTTGILDASTYTITQDAAGGAFSLLANSTFKIGGTNTLPTFTTYSFDSTSTVEYNGAVQTISAAASYGNLVMSTAGNKTAAAALTIQKNLTLTNGTFIGGAYTHLVGGNWSMASGAFTNTGTTITLNGTMTQTVTSTGAFNNITVNKAAAGVTLGGSITFSGTLTFTAGIIATGTYSVITTSGTISGAAQGIGWVNGNLQRSVSNGANVTATFQVGCGLHYSPVTLTFASVTGAGGALTVGAKDGAHANLATGTITADKNIPRYWIVTNTGSVAFTSYTISLTWNTAQNYAGLNTTLLSIGKYTSATWSYPTITGTPTTSNVQANGITNMGDFVVGEKCDIPATFSYVSSPYCSNAGTATVTYSGGGQAGTFTSTPAGLSINAATGAVNIAASTVGTYTVTNTTTGTGGCNTSATATITITAAPSATISYAGSPFCSTAGTGTVTRSGTSGGTYSSTAGLTINATTGAITTGTSTAGTYTVTYTIAAAGGCSLYTTTASVTITATPSATISYAGSPYCSNGGTASVTFSGTAGGTYSSTAGLTINASTGAITLGTSTAGTYTVTYTVASAGGCSQYTTTTSVTITAAPSATISYAGSPYCSNGGTVSVTFSGTAGGAYSSTAGLSINAATGAITLGTSTAGTYTVTYTVAAASGCSQYTTTASVTITALPSATISYAGTPYCSNAGTGTVTRTGTAGGTYSSTAGLTINSVTGAITTGTSTAGTYTVTYTVASAGGCSQYTTTTSVTITALPSATISYAGSPYCSNGGTASVTFSGTTGGTYSSTAGLSINAATGAITLGTSTAGTYTVTYTVAAAGGCAQYTTTASVTINTAPSATISYAGTPYCSNGGTASVTFSGTTGGTYSSTAGLSINASTGAVTLATSTEGSYTVTYTVAAAGGCSLYSTTASITINTAGKWSGAVSTAWTNTANWQCGVVPAAATNAIIPAGLTNYPTISSGTAAVNDISIASGASLTVTGGTLQVAGAVTNSGTFTATAGTIEMNGTAQTIIANTYNNLLLSGSGTKTAAGALVVNGTLTVNSGVTMDMATYDLSGTLATVTSSGTIKTQSVTATPLASGKTWTGTVEYYKTTGGQTVVAGTYTNLTNSNTSGTNTAAAALSVSGTLTLTAGDTLNMATYALSGSLSTVTGTGTLKTQNSSATPLPSNKTWTGPVYYNSGSAQKIMLGNYVDLNASGGNRSFDTTSTIGISGIFTPGSGTYTITGSKIDFNSSGAQNVPAFTYHNVTVSGGNTKSVAGNISVTNLLFLGDNTTIALGNNFITLKSDSTNTASIAAVPTTAAITYGTGAFTVERYVIGRRKYRLVTSSVTTSPNATLTVGEESKSIWGNWQNSGNNTTANQGTIITGGSAANGFDQQTTTASMYTYDAVTRTFKAFSTANGKNTKYTPLKAGRPYYLFVYGDRTNTITTSNPKNTVLTATGTILTGNQVYDSTSTIPISTTIDQYSLVGNPYASAVDWKTVTKSSVSKTIWAWDPNLNAQGGYVTVTDMLNGILIAPLSGAVKISQYIQPGQAFFVKTSGTNPRVTIKESDKVNSTTNGLFLTTTANPLMAINMLYPSGATSLVADGAVVAFDPSYSNSVNDEDVKKFAGSNEVVSILNSGSLLSVETKKFPGINDTMFLNMQRLTKPVYTLEIFAQDIGAGVFKATLVDKYLNKQTALSLTDTNRISVLRTTDPLSYSPDRFLIVFDNLSVLPVTFTSVKAARQPDNRIRVDWSVENQLNIKNYTIQRSADGVNFTSIGIQAANTDVTGNYSYTDVKPLGGDNFYRVKSTGNDGWVNYSVIVKVKAEAGVQKLSVYPNPVLGGQLNVLMENIPAGTYTIRVINFNGLLVNSTEIKHTGGNQTHTINIAGLAAGNYFVELIQPENTRLVYKVIKL